VVKEKVQQISNKGRVMYKKLLEVRECLSAADARYRAHRVGRGSLEQAEEEQRNLQASCDSLTREARAMAAVVNVQTKQNCTNGTSLTLSRTGAR